MKDLKRRLHSGETVTVCNTDFPTAGLIEYVGTLGFDAVFLDCEHSGTDFREVETLSLAARAAGLASILRPWSKEPTLAARYLSCGIDGLQIPHVDTLAEGQAIIDAMRDWEGDHESKLFVLMIESLEAIENLPKLLELEEVDVFYIGSHDLAISMGMKGRARDPVVRERVDYAVSTIAEAGHVAGMNLQSDLGTLAYYRELGLRWVNVHLKVLMRNGATRFVDAVRRS